jgi:hypothetical protein
MRILHDDNDDDDEGVSTAPAGEEMEKERECFLEEIDKAFVKRKRKREADGTSATLGWKRSDVSTTARHPLSHAGT